MKRPHRDFVVEIRPTRRLTKTKSSSIWGSVDLKAHAVEVEDELRERKDSSAIQSPVQAPTAPDNISSDSLPNADVRPSAQEVSGALSEALEASSVNNQEPAKVDVVPEIRTVTKSRLGKATSRQRAGIDLPSVKPKEASVISDSIFRAVISKKPNGASAPQGKILARHHPGRRHGTMWTRIWPSLKPRISV
ncbi:hypothetical protein [Mesorhizobium sp. YR577]|uniref:hypothetical protein n=1 Tax=Mesorhizobium sp. YR577 TaxID=1884373 RepID=UPI0015871EFC|nr:hypothetical protein [Mesorhizobium sp. YR577]